MTTKTPSAAPSANDAKAERLAKALRDNLRRRKAPAAPAADRDKDDPTNE